MPGRALIYTLEIVGGPYDGAPELGWRDLGRTPPPGVIYVGVCPAGAHCGSQTCRSRAHVSFWTMDEDARPTGSVAYCKQDEYVERARDAVHARAVYAIGGLLEPRNFGELARRPLEDSERREPVVT